MASAINEIYDAIAGWDLYWDSRVPVKVREIQSLKETLDTPEGSVRLISPIDPESGSGGGHIALGKTNMIVWNISDTLFVRPCSSGRSLQNSVPQIINYLKTYLDAVKDDRTPTTQSWIENATHEIGVYNWPFGDNQPYYGVKIVLEVHEVFN